MRGPPARSHAARQRSLIVGVWKPLRPRCRSCGPVRNIVLVIVAHGPCWGLHVHYIERHAPPFLTLAAVFPFYLSELLRQSKDCARPPPPAKNPFMYIFVYYMHIR